MLRWFAKVVTGALQEHDKERSAKSKRLSPGKKLLQLQYVTILYKDGPVDHALVGVLLDARFEFTRPGSIRTIPLAHFFVS